MKCEILYYMRPTTPHLACGTSEAAATCQTHHIDVAVGETLCPIGKIEAATEEALAKIRAEASR